MTAVPIGESWWEVWAGVVVDRGCLLGERGDGLTREDVLNVVCPLPTLDNGSRSHTLSINVLRTVQYGDCTIGVLVRTVSAVDVNEPQRAKRPHACPWHY